MARVTGSPDLDILSVRSLTVVSPHFDDGVLSCGAALAACAATGAEPTVLTVFSGQPEPPLSAGAVAFHRACGLGDDDAVRRRQEEDELALKVVGAASAHLGIPEALYRKDDAGNHLYPRDEDSSRAGLETELVARLAQLLSDEPTVRAADLLLAPLAIGNHIDHRITRAAVRLLDRDPDTVAWYEDAPYVIFPPELLQPVDDSHVDPLVCPVGPDHWQAKLQAIDCYASQRAILLGGNTTDLPIYLTMYAESIGGGVPAERYWRLPAPGS